MQCGALHFHKKRGALPGFQDHQQKEKTMKKVIFVALTVLLMGGTGMAQTQGEEKQPAEQKQVMKAQGSTDKGETNQVATGEDEKKKSAKDEEKKDKDKMCPCMKMMMKQGMMGPEAMKKMQQNMGRMGGMMMQNNMLMMQQMLQQQQAQINDLRRRLDALDKKEKGKEAKESKDWKEKKGKHWRE